MLVMLLRKVLFYYTPNPIHSLKGGESNTRTDEVRFIFVIYYLCSIDSIIYSRYIEQRCKWVKKRTK